MTTETKRLCDKCGRKIEVKRGILISTLNEAASGRYTWWTSAGEFCSTRCAISYLVKRLRKGAGRV